MGLPRTPWISWRIAARNGLRWTVTVPGLHPGTFNRTGAKLKARHHALTLLALIHALHLFRILQSPPGIAARTVVAWGQRNPGDHVQRFGSEIFDESEPER
jgi:hypothetical protein